MAEPVPPASPPPERPKSDWAKPALWAIVFAFITLNAALVLRTCRQMPGEAMDKAGQVVQQAGRALAQVASAFNQGTVRTEFISYATSISNHQRFQFATLRQ